jgi:DNA invertase Pin-like site-specific DNA recombinase
MTAPVDLTTYTAVGYIRVSSEAQAGEKQTSLDDQRAAIAQLAAKLGVTVDYVFEDAGVSGETIEYRPGMRALVASCESSARRRTAAGYVLVLNDSRWGRFEQSEESAYWRVHLEKRGWRVRFAEHDDVQDDTVRPVLRAIVQSQASHYRKTLAANVRRGARGQAEQGYWQAKAPFGYQRQVVYPADRARMLANHVPKATDEKLVLAPHPDEAPIVQAVFAKYVEGGQSLTSLLEWVSGSYPSRLWTRSAVLRLLTNPAYVGDVVWGRVSIEPGRRTTRPDGEWYGKTDAHPALVSRELFAAAVRRIGANKQRTRGVRSSWVLSGIVRCRCGRGLTGAGESGSGPVYACSSRGAHHSRRCEYPGAVLQHLLESAAIGVLAREIGSSVHRRMMAAAIDEALAAATAEIPTTAAVDRELTVVVQKQQRLVLAVESGTLTSAEASARMSALRRDAERLTRAQENAANFAAAGAHQAWREQLVTQALDFRTMAAELKGSALRELLQLWLKRAEFNTTTRELTMEIRRVPAMLQGVPSPTLFEAEGEPSSTKSGRRSRVDATIVRRVIVGRRTA